MKRMQCSGIVNVGCLCLMGLLLVACGGSEQAGNPPATTVATPAVKPAATPTDTKNPLANMVKAVAADAKEQPFELRFEVITRPAAGEPFDVKLNLLSLMDASGLEMQVVGVRNVNIVSGARANFTALKTGESASHLVRLQGAGAGILLADVQLTATVGGNPRTINYSIPVAIVAAQSDVAGSASKTTAGS